MHVWSVLSAPVFCVCVCKLTESQSPADLSVNMDIWSASVGKEGEGESARMTQRCFLASSPHVSTGRPQRAETSYPPRTCSFPKA